ncbi:MAG: type II toxin-antitoxin system PemK/MazF family toxin [Nitrospirae bacterium]|nr:type II toxin-antitoxin system PemK/MazF family toxin [Nitrospirota bacterium]
MKRGDIVTVSASVDYGKPQPSVVIQSDWLKTTDSVLVCLFTSTLVNAPIFRLSLEPTETNGLKQSSQIMVDKIIAIPREKCGKVIGSIDEGTRLALNHMLAVIIGIAD